MKDLFTTQTTCEYGQLDKEENMKFPIPQDNFDLRVERIANRLATG